MSGASESGCPTNLNGEPTPCAAVVEPRAHADATVGAPRVLPSTGTNPAAPIAVAGLLVLVGALVVWVARRRRSAPTTYSTSATVTPPDDDVHGGAW